MASGRRRYQRRRLRLSCADPGIHVKGRFVLITSMLVDGNFCRRVFISLVLPDDPKSRFCLFGLGPASDFYNGLGKTGHTIGVKDRSPSVPRTVWRLISLGLNLGMADEMEILFVD